MTYRLDTRDEQALRWGLSHNIRGAVGVRSSAGGWEAHGQTLPIGNFKSFRLWMPDPMGGGKYSKTEDVGYRCGPLVIAPKRQHGKHGEFGGDLITLSEKEREVQAAVLATGAQRIETLSRVYCDVPHGGLETFDDVAALIADTRNAPLCLTRERADTGRDLVMLEALRRLSQRCGPHPALGTEASAADLDLFNAIYDEADARLSRACKAFAGAMRDARRLAEVRKVA